MPDYNKGKIYTIRCYDDPTLIYVGSTTQTISQRWNDHKKNAQNPNKRDYSMKVYETMRERGLNKFYIELYEEVPCTNREQLGKREGEIIREIGSLNKQITGRTIYEYNQVNKEHKREYMKDYHVQNRDKRSDYSKEYRNAHIEELTQKSKEYREKNLEKIKEKKAQKITCECGCIITVGAKPKHVKTKNHLSFMVSKQEETI